MLLLSVNVSGQLIGDPSHLGFNILIWEDANVLPRIVADVKTALNYLKILSRGPIKVEPESPRYEDKRGDVRKTAHAGYYVFNNSLIVIRTSCCLETYL